jgi:Xaa-Pro aminopeptidase
VFDLDAIQAALRQEKLDAWLLYDFRGLNVLARRVAQMAEGGMLSRRWFYFIPVAGEPRKLVHRIEAGALDHMPGAKTVYLRWQELEAGVEALVKGTKRLAMEYVPRNANPYVSRVDAGTVELVRAFGAEVVPSGDLIQRFEACWDDDQWAMHLEAAKHTRSAFDAAFGFIAQRLKAKNPPRETEVVRVILDHFKANHVVCDHPPICAVGPNSGNPHYEPIAGKDAVVTDGSFVLIDLWAKKNKPGATYNDICWTGYLGKSVPEKYTRIFEIVKGARDAAVDFLKQSMAARKSVRGCDVDDIARNYIVRHGYGEFFIHRTGHSITEDLHGSGANLDNLETRDERTIIPETAFSVEPGIYFLGDFGIRSEINVYISKNHEVIVPGEPRQQEVVAILK